jgi:heterodisulfide reductase subunit A
MVRKKEQETRIGVFICSCGSNIGGVIDVEKLSHEFDDYPGVALSTWNMFTCSKEGQTRIADTIKEESLTGVVVASCTPKLHEELFRDILEESGLNRFRLAQANLREHDTWVHGDEPEEAYEVAYDLVSGAIERAKQLEDIGFEEYPVEKSVLVIGGGIAGIQAALDLSAKDIKVTIIEKNVAIGGYMPKLEKTFPTLDCSMCILSPKLSAVDRSKNIKLLTCSEVMSVERDHGNFKVKVKKRPRFIDLEKCNACGDCNEVCPVLTPNEHDFGLSKRKAVYKPYPQAVPSGFAIEKLGHAACKLACPAHVSCQGFVTLTREKKYAEALRLVREAIPFPGSLGRVCFSACEDKCERGTYDESVSIRNIHRFLYDYERENKTSEPVEPHIDKEERIAIVGGGPAGIACAYQLARLGYPATIFEASSEAGGLMRWGIPDHRLPRDILRDEINRVIQLGVDIQTGTRIDSLEQLWKKGFKAIFLGTGAPISSKLRITGEDAEGVYHALDFLNRVNNDEEVKIGNNVAIIGGGNAAVDGARVACRLGSDKVTIIYRRSRIEMPAIDEEIDEAINEGTELKILTQPIEVLVSNGYVSGLKCIKMELGEPDESGRRRPVPIPDSEFEIEIDTLIIAIGQSVSPEGPHAELDVTPWGTPKIDSITMQTSMEGVFAGGDLVTGPASVIEAVGAGNEAAKSIHRYLRGLDLLEGRPELLPQAPHPELEDDELPGGSRVSMPKLSKKKRLNNFEEVELGFSEEAALEESKRCLGCAVCCECKLCVEACQKDAIDHYMKEEIIELTVGGIIAATGFQEISITELPEYGGGKYRRVITGGQYGRLLSLVGPTGGEVLIPPDFKEKPKRIAYINCAGSRDENCRPWCCNFGCMYTLRHAEMTNRLYGDDVEQWIIYHEMRTAGKEYEQFYRRVREHGVRFVRGFPSDMVEEKDGTISFTIFDQGSGQTMRLNFDLVVLTMAIDPSEGTAELAHMLGVDRSQGGFMKELHPKLEPVNTKARGVYIAGTCQSPKDIPSSVADAKAAASAAASHVLAGKVRIQMDKAIINEELCIGCGLCEKVCPFDAISMIEREEAPQLAEVNSLLCTGCGKCQVVCPTGAASRKHFTTKQLESEILGLIAAHKRRQAVQSQ